MLQLALFAAAHGRVVQDARGPFPGLLPADGFAAQRLPPAPVVRRGILRQQESQLRRSLLVRCLALGIEWNFEEVVGSNFVWGCFSFF